jgi:hypothetical protein
MTLRGADLFQIANFGRQISFGLTQTTDFFVGYLGLTQLVRCAFGRAVRYVQVCAVFPRVARKNRTQEDRPVPCCRRL